MRTLAVCVAVLLLVSCAAHPKGATVSRPPTTRGEDLTAYRMPTVADITETLERIRVRLEAGAPVRLAGGVMDSGPEKKFAPLHYSMGVIDSGLLAAADVTGDKRFDDLPSRQFQFYYDHLAQALAAEREKPGQHGLLWNLAKPNSLDSCGAMGTAMIQAKLAGVGPDMDDVIRRWAEYVHLHQYRLPDGTLARQRPFPQSLWIDDAYMGPPILAEMGKLTGDAAYSDDAAMQMKLFYRHLFVPEAGLFTHGMHMGNAGDQPGYFWGRANGWYAMGLATVLDVLPAKQRDRAKLLGIFRRVAKGLASCQSGTGLWHQMLDRPDSYLETSCSAMFTYALAKGVNEGWLDAGTYGPVAIAGWDGVRTRIDSGGHVLGTCVGTTYAADYIYYYHQPARDDEHGYGPVLLAGAEMIRLAQNPHLRVELKNGAIMVNSQNGEH